MKMESKRKEEYLSCVTLLRPNSKKKYVGQLQSRLRVGVSVATPTITQMKQKPTVTRWTNVHAKLFTKPRAFVNFSAN